MSFIRFAVLILPDRRFVTSSYKPTGWTHVVLNYIGPNNGEGITIYYNGVKVVSDKYKDTRSLTAGDGRIVVGRLYTDQDQDYASVEVDELIYFDTALTSDDVQLIHNSA